MQGRIMESRDMDNIIITTINSDILLKDTMTILSQVILLTTCRIKGIKAITRSLTTRHQSATNLDSQSQGHHMRPLDRFKVKCAPFRQPIEIGSFSYDEQRNFIMDDSQLQYYFPPDLSKPNNLSVNYDKYISRDLLVDEHIDALLDSLICIRDKEDEEERINSQQQSEGGPSSQDTLSGANSGNKDPRRQQQNRVSMTRADFICYRGILTKIMCTPYTRNEPWELGATLYRGSIYIEEHVTDEKRQSAGGSSERHKLMSYWGYRFETICNISKPVSELQRIKMRKRRVADMSSSTTSKAQVTEALDQRKKAVEEEGARQLEAGVSVDRPNAESVESVEEENTSDDEFEQMDQVDPNDPVLLARLDGIVDTNLQYCTVARTKIGQNSIIMGAEVDCTSEPKKPPPHNPLSNYIELKTSRVISNPREQSSFEKHKLLKFWAQSFLPGIPTIIVGFRDDDGNVVHVQTFKTMEIPRLVRGKEGAW
ncbi:Dom-3 Z, partial [Podila epicladia]